MNTAGNRPPPSHVFDLSVIQSLFHGLSDLTGVQSSEIICLPSPKCCSKFHVFLCLPSPLCIDAAGIPFHEVSLFEHKWLTSNVCLHKLEMFGSIVSCLASPRKIFR